MEAVQEREARRLRANLALDSQDLEEAQATLERAHRQTQPKFVRWLEQKRIPHLKWAIAEQTEAIKRLENETGG